MSRQLPFKDFKLIDLTHSLNPTIPHWGEGCGFKVHHHVGQDKIQFFIQKLEISAGIGTHMDAPAHCIEGALTIENIPLERLLTQGYMIDVSHKTDEHYKISKEDITEFEKQHGKIEKNTIVLFHTGWSRFWNDPERYRNNYIFPSISKEVAELLLERDVNGLGIDTLSPDCSGSGFPVHQLFLSHNKFIIENVANANQLPSTGAIIFVLPIKIEKGTEAPVRLIAMVS